MSTSSTIAPRITVVLRPAAGGSVESIMRRLQLSGLTMAMGEAVICAISEGDAIEEKSRAAGATSRLFKVFGEYQQGVDGLEQAAYGMERLLMEIEQIAKAGSAGDAIASLHRIRELAGAFLDSSGARANTLPEVQS